MSCEADGTGCPRCDRLPETLSGDQTLYLWPPQGHSGGKLARHLKDAAVAYETGPDGQALQLRLADADSRTALTTLPDSLSVEELQDTRVLTLEPGREPGFQDYPRVTSLHRTLNFLRAEPLLGTLQDESFEVHYAPIVFADDYDDVLAYHARLAFPAIGAPANAVFDLARKADLLHQLDRAARIASIDRIADAGIRKPIFVEFQPAAIYDPVYCLQTTVAAAKDAGIEPQNIVFTLSHPDRGYDIAHLQNILSYYRQRGFRVALGQLGAGLGSLELLQHLRPEFAWLSTELVAGIEGDPYRGVIARKLLEMAHRLRVETIAESGASANDRDWLYEHGASYLALDPDGNGSTGTTDSSLPEAAQ